MRINHNIASLNTYRQLTANNANGGKSLEKLSSGLRINRAGDDAAGLAISEKMRGQIRGLDQASRNAQDSISLIQTAEGALNETHSILQRMRELGVQASNDTNNTADRGQIQKEIDQLTSEVNRIGNTTEFNTMKLLNGDRSATKTSAGATTVSNAALTVVNSKGFTSTSGGIKLTGNVAVAAVTDDSIDWTNLESTATNTLKLTKNSDGTLKVEINATDATAAAKVLNVSETIDPTLISGSDIVYNNHGFNFTIKKADLTAATTGATVTLDLNTAAGLAADGTVVNAGYSPITDFKANVDGVTFAANTVTVTGAGVLQDARSFNVIGDATGKLTVNFFDAEGNNIMADEVDNAFDPAAAGATTFDYNENGVSFTLNFAATTNDGFETNKVNFTTSTAALTEDASLAFQVGANENQSMSLAIGDMRSVSLGISSASATTGFNAIKSVTNGTNNTTAEFSLDVSTAAAASKSITTIQAAIDKVSDERSKLGAVQNRLEHTINNLGTTSENLTASESRVRDVDMAKEMMEFTKNNILTQAAQAMLAQANQQPQGVLQLLR